jgi:hypothetical protein
MPLIIWEYGGGWQNGSKEGCPPLRNGYTTRGYAVASIVNKDGFVTRDEHERIFSGRPPNLR